MSAFFQFPTASREKGLVRIFFQQRTTPEAIKSRESSVGTGWILFCKVRALSSSKLIQSEVIESMFASIGLGVVALDRNGVVLLSNAAAARLLGIGVEQVAIADWTHHFGLYLPDGSSCPAILSPVVRAISGEEATMILLIRNQLASGRFFWCSIGFRPLTSSTGEIEGAILLIQDITERKKLADEVARSNAALQQFATVAAHDLQEPLRSISGFSDMLAQQLGENLDEKSTRYLSKIKDGIIRMQTLINDLLDYSRIQTKPQELNSVDCNKILSVCKKNLDGSIREKGVRIDSEPLPTVAADTFQILQLFQNLLGNAIKFSAPERPPVLHISAERQGTFWQFSFTDNGIGIEAEFIPRIFGVFQRLHTRTAYPGNGIGLAICQSIVDRHGGRIWVESESGVGSTFYFTLPAVLEDK